MPAAPPIKAELASPVKAELASPMKAEYVNPAVSAITAEMVMAPPNFRLPPGFENLSATGGAVGALVLGVWSVLGSLLTPYAAINSILGIILGLWGFSSQRKRLAAIGVALCIAGLIMSLFEVSRIVSLFFAEESTI